MPTEPLPSEEELKEILARSESASIGPWTYRERGTTHSVRNETDRHGLGRTICAKLNSWDRELVINNMIFMSHARADVPRLVRAILDAHRDMYASEKICQVYFELAAECIGESEVRRRRNERLYQILGKVSNAKTT